MQELKFTKEQLQAIANGDMDARNTFYFDNLDIIKRMARKWAYKCPNCVVSVEDLVQGVYVDMDFFCNTVGRPVCDRKSIIGFLHWSFHCAPYGGLAYCREYNKSITSRLGSNYNWDLMDIGIARLDKPINYRNDGKQTTLGDTIADSRIDLFEDSERYISEYVKTFGKYLTPVQREVFSFALEGYNSYNMGDKLLRPKTERVIRKTNRSIFYRFFQNIEEVMKDLERLGISAPMLSDSDLQRIAESVNKRRAYFSERSRKQRERNPDAERERKRRYRESHREELREANRRYHARKRAERNGNDIA